MARSHCGRLTRLKGAPRSRWAQPTLSRGCVVEAVLVAEALAIGGVRPQVPTRQTGGGHCAPRPSPYGDWLAFDQVT